MSYSPIEQIIEAGRLPVPRTAGPSAGDTEYQIARSRPRHDVGGVGAKPESVATRSQSSFIGSDSDHFATKAYAKIVDSLFAAGVLDQSSLDPLNEETLAQELEVLSSSLLGVEQDAEQFTQSTGFDLVLPSEALEVDVSKTEDINVIEKAVGELQKINDRLASVRQQIKSLGEAYIQGPDELTSLEVRNEPQASVVGERVETSIANEPDTALQAQGASKALPVLIELSI